MGRVVASMNRLESVYETQEKVQLNSVSSKLTIKDADIAKESVNHARVKIMQDVSTILFSQSNKLQNGCIMNLVNGIA